MLVIVKHFIDPFFGAEIIAKKFFATTQTHIRQVRTFDDITGTMGIFKDEVLRFYPDAIMDGTLHSTDAEKVSGFFNSLSSKGWDIKAKGLEHFPKYKVTDIDGDITEPVEEPVEEKPMGKIPQYRIRGKKGAINSLTTSQVILYQYLKEKADNSKNKTVIVSKGERSEIAFLNYDNGIVLTPERILQLARSVRLKGAYNIECMEGGDIAFHLTEDFESSFIPTEIPENFRILDCLAKMPDSFDGAFLRREAYRLEKEKRIAQRAMTVANRS